MLSQGLHNALVKEVGRSGGAAQVATTEPLDTPPVDAPVPAPAATAIPEEPGPSEREDDQDPTIMWQPYAPRTDLSSEQPATTEEILVGPPRADSRPRASAEF